MWIWVVAAVVVAVAVIVGVVFAVRGRSTPPVEAPPEEPQVEDEPQPEAPETAAAKAAPAAPAVETPEPVAGRLVRLRSRLARSNNALGKGLLALLASDRLDDDVWDEVEETLLTADVGMADTTAVVERLRERVKVLGTRDPEELRGLLKSELTAVLEPDLDRSIATASPSGEGPAVILMVGVNGSGKTTTCGRVARVLVAEGKNVVMGAADTFRAAAAEQLETWGARVGAKVVRRGEGADPASVAFDAVKAGAEDGADVVLVDTAGRLQNKSGLMDELGKVKRVIEKQGPVAETLLVLDATTGQNGLQQAKVFGEVVQVTGIVLTKLDGSAKGGIVIAVQRQLGVPVKLVGLGEGPDDLAPFEVGAFVDALVDGTES
ncbi:signal recognition particle-docking protein FtsY [Glycomyces terrestris]|uniref:Signal recognition particle receptor FtsY n=1 Tax=Glycomyces terrestris TaxID=2493553 RepID=A0A426V1X4_9ACTN|nr:signal recognition particle-docking protein FtsY [Glycomyces terrestris]